MEEREKRNFSVGQKYKKSPPGQESAINGKHIIGIAGGILLIAMAFIKPSGSTITPEMSSTLFLIAAAILMWITECIPYMASALVIIVLLPLLGLQENLAGALNGFTSTATYFCIASVALGLSISKTRIPTIILSRLLRWSKGKISRVLLAFMILSYFISMWVSDMGAVVLALSFVTNLCEALDESGIHSRGIKAALALSAPIGAVLGGNSLIVGSTVNIVTVNMLNSYSGQTITFLQWLIIGLPACLVTLFLIWRVLIILFKLKDIPADITEKIADEVAAKPAQVQYEKITILMVAIIAISWFMTTWVKKIDITSIAILGMGFLFIPKYGAISWSDFKKGMPWEIMFLGACSIILGKTVNAVGLTGLLSDYLAGVLGGIGQVGMIFVFALVLTFIVMLIPVGPATASMMTIPAYMLAEKCGLNPIANVMVVGIFAANSCILPLNATFLLPFSRKMFTLKECAKTGLCLSLIWIVVCAIWLPISCGWLFPV